MSPTVTSHLCDRPALPVRLDKFLREAVGLTRREVETAWAEHRIDAPVEHPAALVFPTDEVLFDGQPVNRRAPEVYCLLNKPRGVLTARQDPYDRPCLEPWLGRWPRPVFPVGRLDRATTGLLMLTDDGDLAHLLMHPQFHISKVYLAELAASHCAEDVDVAPFLDGLELEDGYGKALTVRIERSHPKVVLRIEVDEGRKHFVRNLVHVAGYTLDQLHRVKVGSLELGDLEPGAIRTMGRSDVETLWRGVGGQEMVWERRFEALRARSERWREQGRPDERLEDFLDEIER